MILLPFILITHPFTSPLILSDTSVLSGRRSRSVPMARGGNYRGYYYTTAPFPARARSGATSMGRQGAGLRHAPGFIQSTLQKTSKK